jgi:hypothetical protein
MAGFSLTHEERVALTFIAHNDPRDGFVRRTWLEFKTAICGLLQRTRSNGWISVEERLPEIDTNVLAAFVEDGKQRVSEVLFADYSDVDEPPKPEWCGDYGRIARADVTHWMPLPEPPEAK